MNKFSSDSRFVRRGEGGFSLVELLVAVTVFTIIMSSVYMVFRAGLRAFRIQEDRNYAIENFRSSWRQLSRDLRCAFKPQPGRYVFRGGHTSGAFGGSDKVIFTSFLPPAQSMNGGLSEIEYYIDSDPGTNEDGLVRVNRGFAGIAASEQEPVIQEIAPLAKELASRVGQRQSARLRFMRRQSAGGREDKTKNI